MSARSTVCWRAASPRGGSGIAEVAIAQCHLLSQIGSPATDPAIVHVRASTHDGGPVERFEGRMRDIAHAELGGAITLVRGRQHRTVLTVRPPSFG
jgi:S-adenosylmethionine synthetase